MLPEMCGKQTPGLGDLYILLFRIIELVVSSSGYEMLLLRLWSKITFITR